MIKEVIFYRIFLHISKYVKILHWGKKFDQRQCTNLTMEEVFELHVMNNKYGNNG